MCAGSLIGMEKENKGNLRAFEQLPKEVRQIIAQTALEASTTVDEAIKAIQSASAIYGGVKLDDTAATDILLNNVELFKKILPNHLYEAIDDLYEAIEVAKNLQVNNLKNFTKLVHILADKFEATTMSDLARDLGRDISKQYIKLGRDLAHALSLNREKDIANLIQQGADVNFNQTNANSREPAPLNAAIRRNLKKNVQLLLDLGAIPTDLDVIIAQQIARDYPDDEEAITIKNLIRESWEKNKFGKFWKKLIQNQLSVSIHNHDLERVQQSFIKGAKPTANDLQTAQNEAYLHPNNEEVMKIKDLIEEAIKKQ